MEYAILHHVPQHSVSKICIPQKTVLLEALYDCYQLMQFYETVR